MTPNFNRILLLPGKIVPSMNLTGVAFVEANVEINNKHLRTPELRLAKYT
jgi:hypothetical protein